MNFRRTYGSQSEEDHAAQRVEEAVAIWEERCENLEIPDLFSLLTGAEDFDQVPVLVELVKIDQEYRWYRGGSPPLEDYLKHAPELSKSEDTIQELLVAECLTRGSLGALPTADELRERFPDLAGRIDLKQVAARLAAEDSPAMGLLDATGDGDTPPKAFDPTATRPQGPSPLEPGRKFGPEGRYEVIEELGHGGMATVYLVLDTRLQRKMAVKVLHLTPEKGTTGEGDEGMKRWLSEAQMSARFRDHPNLCRVYDAGQWEDLSYIVLQWIEGESLDKKLARGEISPREAARLACKLARVLEEVHAAGIVHRDLKPSNVMINQKGEPVLLDFGISKLLESAAPASGTESPETEGTVPVRFTGYSQVPGTLPWMAPEQLLGKVDSRSDVYSLGVMLFQMLTGRLPHTSPTLASQAELHRLVDNILHADPGSPEVHNPQIDPALAKICCKAMAKNPKSRYSSMEAMATALESYLGAESKGALSGRRRFVGKWALVGLAFATLLVAAAVVVMKTGEGTVVVVVDEPGAEVLVNGVVVEIKDGKATSAVKVGESEVEVSSKGREPVKKSVRVCWRGERVVVNIPAVASSGRVHQEGNAIWNNKVYISWGTVQHSGQPDATNMIIDTWRVDDDGDGDPRNDEDRIRQKSPGCANGIFAFMANVSGQLSDADAKTILNDDGSVTVTMSQIAEGGTLICTYTIKPDDENVYAELVALPRVDSIVWWGIFQAMGEVVSLDPGDLATYDWVAVNNSIHIALLKPRSVPAAEGEDFWNEAVPQAGAGRSILISTKKQWATGMVVVDAPRPMQMHGRLQMSSKLGRWRFDRNAALTAPEGQKLQAGQMHRFAAIFRAEKGLNLEGFTALTYDKSAHPEDMSPGRVHQEGNAIWNNKVYISWQNVTHVYQPDSENMVLDTWKVDDDGDGDPRNDENRIQHNHEDCANGIQANLGTLVGTESAAITDIVRSEDGSIAWQCGRTSEKGIVRTTYRIRPNDENIYVDFRFTPKDKSEILFGIIQKSGVWVSNEIGKLTVYDRVYLDGVTHSAARESSHAESAEGKDYWRRSIAKGDSSCVALISAEKQWVTGMVVLDVPVACKARGDLVMSSTFGGWAFGRNALVEVAGNETFGDRREVRFSTIFHADRDMSLKGIKKLLFRGGPGWQFPGRDAVGSNYQPYPSKVKTTKKLHVEHTLGASGSLSLTGDVNGDGMNELVRTEGDQLYIYDHKGRLQTQKTIPMPQCALRMLDDVDGDGVADIGVGGRENSAPNAYCYFYDGKGDLKKSFARAVGFDGGICPVVAISPGKVLVSGESGFSKNPRGLFQYDYATGEVDWSYDLGFAGRNVSVADIDGDGKREITVGWASIHNGNVANGTSDEAIYLTVTDDNGKNLLTQKYPEPDEGAAHHIFTDLDRNGEYEILGIEHHGADKYQGANQVHLYDVTGKTLHTYTGPAGELWRWAVADIDGDDVEDVIVGGKSVLTVLDDQLRNVRSINEDGFVELAADLTGDGSPEIVTLNSDGLLRVYNGKLELVDAIELRGKPAIGRTIADDIDDDGIVELVVPSSVGSHVVAFRHED